MDYPEFRETIFQNLQAIIPDEVTIRLLDVEKLNGSLHYGILFTKEDGFFSPTIYLESFYSAYLKGEDIDTLSHELLRCYHEETKEPPESIYHLNDFAYVKEHIFAKLIHFKENENILQDIPHSQYLDFAIIPYFELEPEEAMQGTIQINYAFLKVWKVTKEELLLIAIQNTKDKKGICFTSILDFLSCRLEEDEDMQYPEAADKLYVLTNESKHLGAVMVYYSDVLQMIRKVFEEDYYLLPASIHEWIALPISCAEDVAYLQWIVRQVSETEVLPEEVLSDNVYRYDFATKSIMIV